MRILFVGAVRFSSHVLGELVAMGEEIVGVCTLEASNFNSDHKDLTPIALRAGIPVRYTPIVHDNDNIAWIKSLQPDIIFCVGWSKLLPPQVLSLPPLGVIGYHPAALPQNRGRHPIIWSLVLGLTETASTFFFMDEYADSGDLLSQVKVPIHTTDDAKILYQRLTNTAIQQLRQFLPVLKLGKIQRVPQNHSAANIWRKRTEQDGCIDWRMSAESIYNLVRGLTKPYVGAHFYYMDNKITVWKAEIEKCLYSNVEPGKILAVDEASISIKTGGEGIIRLIDYYPAINCNVGEYL